MSYSLNHKSKTSNTSKASKTSKTSNTFNTSNTSKNINNINSNQNSNIQKLNNLIHFGCWNEGGCSTKRTNPLSFVKNELYKFDKTYNIDTYLIAGDNYYQPKNKDKGIILFNNKQFEEGFKCLSNLKGHKYILLGNHDTTSTPKISNSTSGNDLHMCHTLHKQIEFVNAHKSNFTMVNQNTKQHLYLTHSKTLFVLLDTNLLQADYEKVKEVLECSIEYYNFTEEHLNVEDFIKTYIKTIYNSIVYYISSSRNKTLNVNNLVFVGHHPIYGSKSKIKDGKHKNKSQNLSHLAIELITNIINMINPRTIYHLCADIHNYQYNILKITFANKDYEINQYITGTGGASQDLLPILPIKSLNTDTFTITSSTIKSLPPGNFGFLHIEELINGDIKFNIHTFNYETILLEYKKKQHKKQKNKTRMRRMRRISKSYTKKK